MAAQWRLLTEHLSRTGESVWLSWSELDAIVGGLPASAIDHYPQWWHGDRPNKRAWRAAGYEAIDIRPGVSVRFVRSPYRAEVAATQPFGPSPNPMQMAAAARLTSLVALEPSRCLVVIPCSKSKRQGGRRGVPTSMGVDLGAARRKVLDLPESEADESRVLPARQRYNGSLYRAVGQEVLDDLAASGRLVILSGGYGVLDGRDLIGSYNRLMKSSDWPAGLLEKTIAVRAEQSGMDVVAFAAATTEYAKVLRRTPWRLAGRTAQLVTIRDVRGVGAVSTALGLALNAFVRARGEFPAGTVVQRLA